MAVECESSWLEIEIDSIRLMSTAKTPLESQFVLKHSSLEVGKSLFLELSIWFSTDLCCCNLGTKTNEFFSVSTRIIHEDNKSKNRTSVGTTMIFQ